MLLFPGKQACDLKCVTLTVQIKLKCVLLGGHSRECTGDADSTTAARSFPISFPAVSFLGVVILTE